MQVIDADAHVIETAATFADPYWDPALADRRPRVVDLGQQFAWLIDDVLYPKTRGSKEHESHRTRAKPCASTPHVR